MTSGNKLKLQIEDLHGALVIPLAINSSINNPLGGVVGSDLGGHFRLKNGKISNITDNQYLSEYKVSDITPINHIRGTAVYGGIIFNQFGHFMAESIHRLWMRNDEYSYIFLVYPNRNGVYPSTFDDLLGYQKETFEYLGVDRNIILISAPTKIDKLIVPSQASVLGKNIVLDQQYLAYLKNIELKNLSVYTINVKEKSNNSQKKKIYVSRSHLSGKSSMIGESYLEKALQADDFYIMRPDHFKIEEKLALYRNAELLIFPEGSAIHGLEVLGDLTAKIIILARTKIGSIETFKNVFTSRGVDIIVYNNIETISSLRWSYENNQPARSLELCRTDPEKLIKFLRDNSIATLSRFSLQDFHAAESEDALKYILEIDIRNTKPPEFMELFLQFRKDIKKKI